MPAVIPDVFGVRFSSFPRRFRWPQTEFFVAEQRRLLYCPIQKIACSSLKLWWAELVDGPSAPYLKRDATGRPQIDHPTLNARFTLNFQSPTLRRRSLFDANWFRFVFVRNPWARLVSAFVNKFLYPDEIANPVFDAIEQSKRSHGIWRTSANLVRRLTRREESRHERSQVSSAIPDGNAVDWKDAASFHDFVDYLSRSNLDKGRIDHHWRPQHRFLGNTRFDFVGRFERLEEDVHSLARVLDVDVMLPMVNRTHYAPQLRELFADCPLKRLRELPAMPDYRQFYTPELRQRVARLYRTDVERFGYTFDN